MNTVLLIAANMHLPDPVPDTSTCMSSLEPRGYMASRIEDLKKDLRKQGIHFDACCTSSMECDCWMVDNLTPWNKILCTAGVELKHYKPGRLELSEFGSSTDASRDNGCLLDATFVALWLVRRHGCIDSFKPSPIIVGLSSGAFKEALASNATLHHFHYDPDNAWQRDDHYIAEAIGQLKNLESLHLSRINIRYKGATVIAKMLKSNPHIKRVNFSHNILLHRSSKTLLRALRACPMLTELTFSHNNIGKEGLKCLSQLIARSQSLEKLTLDGSITTEDVESLVNVLKANTTIREISFQYTSVDRLADAIRENKSIRCAKFTKCSVKDGDCTKLAQMLEQNSTLQELHLTHNSIQNYGASVLATMLRNNISLKKLFLDSNQIENRGLVHLIEALATNESLRLLDITSNSDEEDDSDVLRRALATARAYGRVRLHWEDSNIAELAIALNEGNEIEELELDGDKLSTEKTVKVLEALCENSSVKKLILNGSLSYSAGLHVAKVIARNKCIKDIVMSSTGEQSWLADAFHALARNTTITRCFVCMYIYATKVVQALACALVENKTLTELIVSGLSNENVRTISRALGANYTLNALSLELGSCESRNSFHIRELLRRNLSLLTEAACFALSPSINKVRAQAFEKLSHSDGLTKHVVQITSKSEDEVRTLVCGAKEYITANYFRIAGIVKTSVVCYDRADNGGQIDQLNEVCLRKLLSYLSIDDVIIV